MNRSTLVRTAALALIGVCAPLASAEPWFSFRWDHGRHNGRHEPVVIVGGPVVCREPQRPVYVPIHVQRFEVLPCDLHLAAYQSRETVIVVATGTNRSEGFCTALTACELNEWAPTLTLRNTSPETDCAAQGATAFTLSASIRSCHALRCITVHVAGQSYEVPVVQTQCLS